MGLVLLLGGLIVVDLRMAGHLRVVKPGAAHQILPTNREMAEILVIPERKIEQIFTYLLDNRVIQVRDEGRLGEESRSVMILQPPAMADVAGEEPTRTSKPRPSVETRRKALAEPTGHAWWSIVLS